MKCEIIRDLLPSYVDGLTSVESDKVIEEHLKNCERCRDILNEMRTEITAEDSKKDTDIQPFLKIRKATLRKVLIAVCITAAICALAVDIYQSYFYTGVSMSSDEVEITYEEDGNINSLNFLPKEDEIIIRIGYTENKEINGQMPLETISLIKYKKHLVINPASENQYRMCFLDEDTVMYLYSYPGECDFDEDDFIAIEFNDVTKIVKMSDLRDGNIDSLK